MNEKVKKILHIIGAFFVGLATGVLAILLHNRRTTAGVREELDKADRINSDIADGINDAKDTNTGLAESVEQSAKIEQELAGTVKDNKEIIANIRKQQIEK